MKKILVTIFLLFFIQTNCFAQTGVTFLYINGSNNNDEKMKNWYENGITKLHPCLKKEFEKNPLAQKYFLKGGEYFINEEPNIFFWGDKSHDDLTFVEKNLAITRGISNWAAYQVRLIMTHFLHDAIWVQKTHNMLSVLDDLHKSILKEHKKGNKVVMYGYSAGSFVTFNYMLTRAPYINIADFFKYFNTPKDKMDFIAQHPMKNTCMYALGQEMALFTAAGRVYPNDYDYGTFTKNYMDMDGLTDKYCIPDKTVKGFVNFASPLVLFYSDISDPNFEMTYFHCLMLKYMIENDMFWITVNYREDPLGFPDGRNLTINEIEKLTKMSIEPHLGFVYDSPNFSSHRTFLTAHTSYWTTRRNFAKAVVNSYIEGYRFQYDDTFKSKNIVDVSDENFNDLP